MAIPSAIMAISSAKQVVIPSATKIKQKQTLAVAIGVPTATWQLHQPNSGNSISHCGININNYNYVTFHLSQLLPQKSGFHYPPTHVTITSVTKALIIGHKTTWQ